MLRPFVCSLLSLLVFSAAATVLARSVAHNNWYSAGLMSLLAAPAAVLTGLFWADVVRMLITPK